MANEEHLAILRQGVNLWNAWRKENDEIQPNLSQADLSGVKLMWVDFSYANLGETNLSRADLSYGNLTKADLSRANLSRAFIVEANLSSVNLSCANLQEANFSKAFIVGANFNEADLSSANLSCADLSESNFSRTELYIIRALGTNFTGANFTGACLENWHTNSDTNLTNVICDYVYLQRGQQERRPSNGSFASGEFTKLFQKAQKTVDLIFSNGIDWQAFLTSFQRLQVECSGKELTIQAIENKNDGAFVIRVNVPADANKAEIEKYLKREYELALIALEEKYQLQLQGKDEQIEIYRKQSTDLTEIVKLLAGRATYDLRNSQIGGSLINAETVNTDKINGNIHNNA
ncbi:putative protein YjbI, containings pentapeptide repeats [Nostoc flagelliforme CCNUN1]|uniref:Pentapeptide repeat n=1 Tax=Nostoc flagelliforme CCNUN1 TaxID=2038116 RepID=A0A2K8T387_9NOSO|nr:pentapeptide repeat-containing protein [Nostoc flagelliforme]AUB42119.1 putative protein YjbI, containings pentapeptide repeats [Nostoc flagelliforme CCNUN1]